jgi:hypothetical protein
LLKLNNKEHCADLFEDKGVKITMAGRSRTKERTRSDEIKEIKTRSYVGLGSPDQIFKK